MIADPSEDEYSKSESFDESVELGLRFLFCFIRVFSDPCGPLSDIVGSSLETGFIFSGGVRTASTLVAAFLESNVVCFKTFLGIVLATGVGWSPDPDRMLLARIRALASSAASDKSRCNLFSPVSLGLSWLGGSKGNGLTLSLSLF